MECDHLFLTVCNSSNLGRYFLPVIFTKIRNLTGFEGLASIVIRDWVCQKRGEKYSLAKLNIILDNTNVISNYKKKKEQFRFLCYISLFKAFLLMNSSLS